MDEEIRRLAERYRPLAVEILKETIRVPADWVDRPVDQGGDPACGLSNHEGPRLERLKTRIVEVGAVDGPEDVGFDAFGNLVWEVKDRTDGIPDAEKLVVWWDGHTDTVRALRPRWREATGGIDAYEGMLDAARADRSFLRRELGYLPPDAEWDHLVFGRGAADQLSGVVCQVIAAKVLRETRGSGSLRGVIVQSYGTVAEEDNDGGGPWNALREVAARGAHQLPDVVILTEGTGCAIAGAVGIYRGQRGRMQIEVEVTGKSCHGSMPWEGRNPLEYGAAIIAEAAERHARGEGMGEDAFLGKGTRTASFATLDTPSDCAVPERFTFRFDRRLTAGEDPEAAIRAIASLPSVERARTAGLGVKVHAPLYEEPSWRGTRARNPQIYPGWVTPEEHPAVAAAVETYRRVVSPMAPAGGVAGALRHEPRVARWIFSTDGVGYPVRREDPAFDVSPEKRWVEAGAYRHPAMLGVGPGLEQNTHKIGECVDARELPAVIAWLARFPSLYRDARR